MKIDCTSLWRLQQLLTNVQKAPPLLLPWPLVLALPLLALAWLLALLSQLQALQRRWSRDSLAAWWSRSGLSSHAGLARIQAASQENAQKILAVQGELSKAIQHITAFLHSLTDGLPTTDNNANNQCILDAEIKDKKSHTVQITV
ncbi:coiled-coil domain-containing protein 178 [Pipra filicauda]|uniref:Coiled-coil domain-containing protein 178 n=1 Tax=Pipra filicauda TaxID=649802 RepID=A0A7R5KBA9_9PASS|nr:coiled-coil domain-containing protein 178 [Pipra filicauda]